jgi:hypothetical protein
VGICERSRACASAATFSSSDRRGGRRTGKSLVRPTLARRLPLMLGLRTKRLGICPTNCSHVAGSARSAYAAARSPLRWPHLPQLRSYDLFQRHYYGAAAKGRRIAQWQSRSIRNCKLNTPSPAPRHTVSGRLYEYLGATQRPRAQVPSWRRHLGKPPLDDGRRFYYICGICFSGLPQCRIFLDYAMDASRQPIVRRRVYCFLGPATVDFS